MKIREIKIHLNTVRINYYQQNDRQMLSRIWGMMNPYLVLVRLETGVTTMELLWRILKKAKNKSTV